MAKKRSSEPTPISDPISDENAISSQGIRGTVPVPGIKDTIQDKLYDRKTDESLAQGAIRPRNVRGKSTGDKINS